MFIAKFVVHERRFVGRQRLDSVALVYVTTVHGVAILYFAYSALR
jgi:hypothetical protein